MDLKNTDINYKQKSTFFDKASSPFAILDENLVFIEMNQACISILDIHEKDFKGKKLIDVFPEIKDTDRLQSYRKIIATGEPVNNDEFLLKANKEKLKLSLKAFKIGDAIGISIFDVSNLVKTTDKLKIAYKKLEKVNKNLKNKNLVLEEFSYVAIHDLRAPLININSLLEILADENAISKSGLPLFEKIQYVAQLMGDKLKALSNVMALKTNLDSRKEEVKFSEIVKRIKATHSQEIIKSGTIIKEDFSSCPSIIYDPIQVESILHNLISNSIKYKHPNRKAVIFLKSKIINGKPVFSIKDNGLGFDNKQNSDKIFGLFKRMHTHVEGMGIGLYIIQSIIYNNGGNIKVKSELNKGTKFKIYF